MDARAYVCVRVRVSLSQSVCFILKQEFKLERNYTNVFIFSSHFPETVLRIGFLSEARLGFESRLSLRSAFKITRASPSFTSLSSAVFSSGIENTPLDHTGRR